MPWRRWGVSTAGVVTTSVVVAAVAYFAWMPGLICDGVPAKIKIAEAVVKRNGAIPKALDAFYWDMGKYPSHLRELYGHRHSVEDPRYNGPYLAGAFEELKDPWNQPYEYRFPGEVNEDSFDLWSHGPDTKDDGGREGSDDIKNWIER